MVKSCCTKLKRYQACVCIVQTNKLKKKKKEKKKKEEGGRILVSIKITCEGELS